MNATIYLPEEWKVQNPAYRWDAGRGPGFFLVRLRDGLAIGYTRVPGPELATAWIADWEARNGK